MPYRSALVNRLEQITGWIINQCYPSENSNHTQITHTQTTKPQLSPVVTKSVRHHCLETKGLKGSDLPTAATYVLPKSKIECALSRCASEYNRESTTS